jgi:hypothetical protein
MTPLQSIRTKRVVVQFGKISHFVRNDRSAISFVISSECEKSFSSHSVPIEVKLHHYHQALKVDFFGPFC